MIIGAGAIAYIAWKWKKSSKFANMRYGSIPGIGLPGRSRFGYFGNTADPGQGALDAANVAPATPFQFKTLGNPNDQQSGSR
jgi:hypothetical protein